MNALAPWEAPAIVDIDVATGTFGGGTVFTSETVYVSNPYSAFPLS